MFSSHSRTRVREEAELDITSFMNLMIVLVPVLLLSMVFARITVIDIQLPQSAGSTAAEIANKEVEVLIRDDALIVHFPEGVVLRTVDNLETGEPNFAELSLVLQELKRRLKEKEADRRRINLLVEPDTTYHKIVATMDSVRSYQAVVAADVVEAELFPDIAFADAPVASNRTSGKKS